MIQLPLRVGIECEIGQDSCLPESPGNGKRLRPERAFPFGQACEQLVLLATALPPSLLQRLVQSPRCIRSNHSHRVDAQDACIYC